MIPAPILTRWGSDERVRPISFVAIWLKGKEVVEEDEFVDLMEAKIFVLEHLIEKEDELGITCVEVCGGGRSCFKIDCALRTRLRHSK